MAAKKLLGFMYVFLIDKTELKLVYYREFPSKLAILFKLQYDSEKLKVKYIFERETNPNMSLLTLKNI